MYAMSLRLPCTQWREFDVIERKIYFTLKCAKAQEITLINRPDLSNTALYKHSKSA